MCDMSCCLRYALYVGMCVVCVIVCCIVYALCRVYCGGHFVCDMLHDVYCVLCTWCVYMVRCVDYDMYVRGLCM